MDELLAAEAGESRTGLNAENRIQLELVDEPIHCQVTAFALHLTQYQSYTVVVVATAEPGLYRD